MTICKCNAFQRERVSSLFLSASVYDIVRCGQAEDVIVTAHAVTALRNDSKKLKKGNQALRLSQVATTADSLPVTHQLQVSCTGEGKFDRRSTTLL